MTTTYNPEKLAEAVHEVKGYIDTENPEKSYIISNTITETLSQPTLNEGE